MKTSWKIGAIVGLAAIISLAAIGISYAANGNPNPASQSLCAFSWVEPDDNGSTSNHDGYNPVDPGDNGNDPTAAQAPGIPCARASGNVASTSASINSAGDTITFNLSNAYPGYHPTIFFGISNQWNTPGIVSSITLNNPNPSLVTMNLNGINKNQVINSGSEVVGALDVGVGNIPKTGNINYTLSATIVVTQYVQQGQNKTNTYLTSIPNPSDKGQTVLFGAAVTSVGNLGVPTGNVTFMEGTTVLGTGNLILGLTGITTNSLSPGSHSITAVYSGDSNFAGSTSNIVVQIVRYGTTTTLSSSPNPSNYGASVKFTATVNRVGGSGTPTGTVTFYDNGNQIDGNVSLSSGTATLNYSTLAAGSHNITATYNGDASDDSSTSNTVVQKVNAVSTTTSLASSANPSVYGQSIKFTATVSPSGATGAVTFKDSGSTIGTASLSGGTATLSYSGLGVGTHSITAVYGGDGNYAGSTSNAVSQVINKANTATVLSSATNPSVFGQSVKFTAKVTATALGSGTPDGTVTFMDGAAALGTGILDSSGQATFTTSSLTVGSHSIKAVYGGSTNYLGSNSSIVTQTVNKANSTTVLSSATNPSVFGQSVTFTATVTPSTATGSITFKDSSTTLSTVPLSGGSASLSVSTLTVGSHSITAVYGGDSNDNGSTSSSVTQTVNKANSSTSITSATNPSLFGQSVAFKASVTPNTATGTVTFRDGANTIGTASLSGGVATLNYSSLSVLGSPHSITASYGGDSSYGASTSTSVTQTVNKASTSTSVSSSKNPSDSGQAVTFSATVSPVSPGSGTPSGTVQFKDNGSNLDGPVSLSGGTASYSTSGLGVGTHTITAVYSGDGNFTTSTSTGLTQTVNAALVITTSSLPNGTKNVTYPSQTLTRTGGTSPFSWSITSGALPSGLSLNASTGVISGKPTVSGTFNFTVQVTDGAGGSATKNLSIKIN